MKTIPILVFSQIVIPKDFTKIPDSLHFRDSLYRFIIPNKKYNYWKVVHKDDTSSNELIYENKKDKNLKFFKNLSPSNSFLRGCQPDWCFLYIVAYVNKKSEYLIMKRS